MRERKQLSEYHCSQQTNIEVTTAPKFIPIEKLRLLYVPVPKAGCTNWKLIIMVINGDADASEL